MSLLLKALKQAERQNREASVSPEALDIELPATPAPPPATPQQTPLTLSPANQVEESEPFPAIDAADPVSESTLAFAEEDAPVARPATPQQTSSPEAFPRHAPSDESPEAPTAPVTIAEAETDSGKPETAEPEATPASPAPYLRASEAGLVLSRSPNKNLRLLIMAITGIAIGVTTWWTLFDQPMTATNPPVLATPLTARPVVTTKTVVATQAQPPTRTTTQDPAPDPSVSREKPAAVAAALPQSPASSPVRGKSSVEPARVAASPATDTRSDSRPPAPPVRFVRAARPGKSRQTLLNEGYTALAAGNYAQARAAYQTALKRDRNLIDGWVGLASVAAHEGNRSLALEHYQRALNLDPSDPAARSGMIAMRGSHQGQEGESALRTLLSNADDNPTAILALANRLAGQGRWREAQQAYFDANTVQPDRPDTLFNLAVSLEQIRQPAAALQYYEKALLLANSRPHQFDQAVARTRIKALRPAGEL